MNGLTPLLVGWNTNNVFVNVFACEMLPTCLVKGQFALKFSNLSIFSLKFPSNSKFLMSKIPKKFPPKLSRKVCEATPIPADILVLGPLQRAQRIFRSASRIFFHLDWQIDNGFLTGHSWRVLKSWYTSGGPEQRFRRRFVDGLNRVQFRLWHRLWLVLPDEICLIFVTPQEHFVAG